MANEDQKTESVRIRLSRKEIEALDRAAAANRLTRSAYLRLLIENVGVNPEGLEGASKKVIIDTQTMHRLWRELNRQGVNINQIAHGVNSLSTYDKHYIEHIDKVLGEIEEHLASIEDAFLKAIGETI